MLRHIAGVAFSLALVHAWAAPQGKSQAASKVPVQSGPSISAPAKTPPANKLDTAQIHRIYLDGDFDHAIELIEDALRYGGPFSHADSIFYLKHLGVMHAAKYETREKGKGYMLQLLSVEPTAKIMDMYASDMIYMIFKNIQDEFNSSRPIDPVVPEPRPAGGGRSGSKKSYAWVGWTVGTLAAVGGVALVAHTMEEEESVPLQKESVSGE